jgi:hypothetical protein
MLVARVVTVRSTGVVWSECGEVVDFAIHDYPAIIWFGMLVELSD